MAVTPEIQKAVDEILGEEVLPVLSKVDKLVGCLSCNGLAYKQAVKPSDLLVHPANRGGALVNPTEVWQKGQRMLHVGVQPAMLSTGAYCFELSNVKDQRQKQIQLNVDLVASSNGALAPVNGNERFLSVATTHTSAFCKAVEMGCKENPTAPATDIKCDPGLVAVCAQGWPHVVFKSEVEENWPALPAWIQLSMNAQNASFKQVNEVEAASLMSTFMNHGDTLAAALAKVKEADPQCKASLETIAYYVSRYGGGHGQALVSFLSSFSGLAPL